MDCKIIKTWILTDYLDGEIDPAKRRALESHLKNCRACANLLEEAKTTVVKPFENTKHPRLEQEYLWSRIKAEIEEEPKQALWAPKPIFALSTCAALLLAVFVLTQAHTLYQRTYNRQSAAASLEEQLDYFASDETASLGTDMENYFL